jgi:hypothetical protein
VNHDSCSILVRSLVKFWIFIASVIFLLEFFIAPDFPLARHAWSPGLVLAIAPSSLCFLRLVPVPCSLRAALPARVHPRQIIFSLGISDPRAGLAFCKCRADLAISPCARYQAPALRSLYAHFPLFSCSFPLAVVFPQDWSTARFYFHVLMCVTAGGPHFRSQVSLLAVKSV